MRKSQVIISAMLVLNLLALPQFAAMAAEAETIRAQVINSELSEAFDAEGGATKQRTMVYIEDIEHPASLAEKIATDQQPASLSLQNTSSDEGSSQAEIAEIQDAIMKQRAESRALYTAQNTAFAEKYIDSEDIVYISRYSPVILTSLDETEVNQLALKDGVTEIGLYAPSNVAELEEEVEEIVVAPLADSTSTNYLQVIKAATVQLLYSGNGIKIGVFETGIPEQDVMESLNVSDYFTTDTEVRYSWHANMVATIVRTVAPEADIYCASTARRDTGAEYIEAIEWLLSKNVNVINASRVIGENEINVYGSIAKWLDHISYYHSALFVQAAGNSGSNGLFSGAMSYNSIVVGAVDENGVIWNETSQSSSYNPMDGNWASKPDLCAPGVNINETGEPTNTTGNLNVSGTSLATPQVAGDIALMYQQQPSLLYMPEMVKAILTAGVRREFTRCVTQPRLASNAYTQYGAGTLDCTRNYELIRSLRYYDGSLDTTRSGVYADHTITVGAGTQLRVSLAYLQPIELSSYNDHITNPTATAGVFPWLEIEILYNGNVIAGSDNVTNNVKIVEHYTTQSGTYTIRVRSKRIADITSYYGLAWNIS